jgi:hypothetical protein
MVYVGIDLHRNRSQIAVLDRDGGELLSRRIVNDPETFLSLLGELGDEVEIALEATTAGSGSRICLRTRATSCTSRIRYAPKRSPLPG